MPNIKSAKKRVLVNQAKAMQNKAAKSALKTDIKKFEAAVKATAARPMSLTRWLSRRSTRLLPRVCCTRTMPRTRRAA